MEFSSQFRVFPRKEKSKGGIEVVAHAHIYTHMDARNGVVGTCPVPRRTVAGLDLVVGVRACTPCAIRGDGGGERMERVDERGVRPEHVTPDSYTDCCYGINL